MKEVSPGKMLAMGEGDAIPDPDKTQAGKFRVKSVVTQRHWCKRIICIVLKSLLYFGRQKVKFASIPSARNNTVDSRHGASVFQFDFH